jgi:hypothetical protein
MSLDSKSPLNLISGMMQYFNPFSTSFGEKEVVVYCSRRQGPTGLWEMLPDLHYCLFNRGKEHLLKTDVELQAVKTNPSKKSLVLITDDARASVAGRSFGELIKEIKYEFNIAVVYLHENSRNIRLWKDVVAIGPLERGDLGAVVAEEIKCLQNLSEVECLMALSLECGEVLPKVWELEIPILHYIPEFLPTPRQVEHLQKSCRDSTIQLFPSEGIRAKAVALAGIENDRRLRVLESAGSEGFISELKRLAVDARSLQAEEKKQISEIKASGLLDPRYAYPQIEVSGDRPIRDYLAGWRSGWKPRKPCPGFHPGVYRDHYKGLQVDPTVDFIQQGKPDGPWMAEVMREEEIEWLKVKSRKVGKKNLEIRTALHLHLHYTEGIEGLLQSIKASSERPDLFISTTSEEGKLKVKVILDKCGLQAKEIAVFPNRGRDIGPFLAGFGPKLFSDYEIVGHIHSKQSPHAHDDYLQNWVEFLEKGLVGKNGEMMNAILAKMASDPSIGIIYPDDPGCFGWEGNYAYGEDLLKRMGFQSPDKDASMNFPVGTMFWVRTAALKPLIDLNLKWEEYPEEPLSIDGSMLHALERIFGILPELCGFRTVVTQVEGVSR